MHFYSGAPMHFLSGVDNEAWSTSDRVCLNFDDRNA
jgi:hypothetical protein